MNLKNAQSLMRLAAVALAFSLGACATAPQGNPISTGDQQVAGAGTELIDDSITDNYRLEQGDQISIQVFDEPDLTMQQTVGASGVINYSYLGDLRVAGKTAQQLEQEITALLENGFLVNPAVNVAVLEYRPFFINGEVRSPGSYPYQPGLTLDKAIALAGGLTDRASTRKMFLQRAADSGGQSRINMSTPVAPGDIVTIEEGFF